MLILLLFFNLVLFVVRFNTLLVHISPNSRSWLNSVVVVLFAFLIPVLNLVGGWVGFKPGQTLLGTHPQPCSASSAVCRKFRTQEDRAG